MMNETYLFRTTIAQGTRDLLPAMGRDDLFGVLLQQSLKLALFFRSPQSIEHFLFLFHLACRGISAKCHCCSARLCCSLWCRCRGLCRCRAHWCSIVVGSSYSTSRRSWVSRSCARRSRSTGHTCTRWRADWVNAARLECNVLRTLIQQIHRVNQCLVCNA